MGNLHRALKRKSTWWLTQNVSFFIFGRCWFIWGQLLAVRSFNKFVRVLMDEFSEVAFGIFVENDDLALTYLVNLSLNICKILINSFVVHVSSRSAERSAKKMSSRSQKKSKIIEIKVIDMISETI